MQPDRSFLKELSALDPDLLVVWLPKIHRWQVRQWILRHRKGDEQDYYIWKKKSIPIRIVCFRDDEGNDSGYHPLDQRVIYALKLSRHYSIDPEATARMVDASNAKLEQEWAAENADISREVATSIWKHYQEPSVDLGQRGAR
jgi:hypothetical protein